eukprot:61339-Prymnesium_polylepis.1
MSSGADTYTYARDRCMYHATCLGCATSRPHPDSRIGDPRLGAALALQLPAAAAPAFALGLHRAGGS